jgi:hypothetical protein
MGSGQDLSGDMQLCFPGTPPHPCTCPFDSLYRYPPICQSAPSVDFCSEHRPCCGFDGCDGSLILKVFMAIALRCLGSHGPALRLTFAHCFSTEVSLLFNKVQHHREDTENKTSVIPHTTIRCHVLLCWHLHRIELLSLLCSFILMHNTHEGTCVED